MPRRSPRPRDPTTVSAAPAAASRRATDGSRSTTNVSTRTSSCSAVRTRASAASTVRDASARASRSAAV
ncbi:Uncharacterised protein [Mycobacteroides abscessus]|nr:Uncharacterised protein [Mycobacteroides abscessus]